MSGKILLVWFVDCTGLKDFQMNAKMKQLSDYSTKTKFFNKFHVLVVPSKENKFQILNETVDVLPTDPKELENFLTTIKHKLKDCLTVFI